MEDEEFDSLYEDILDNGLVNEDYKLLDALKDNLGQIKDYGEIDASEWGNLYY